MASSFYSSGGPFPSTQYRRGVGGSSGGTSGVHRGNGGRPSSFSARSRRSPCQRHPPPSVDFSFPVEDWDWTVSGLEPTKGDLQATPINFDFLCAASKDWSHWVDREILDPDFWDRLVDAGVHWSILISRSCNMFRDTESLRELLRRWCPSTHTFFFSWGELTPTLEDVANHWMLPILGEHSFSDIKLSAERGGGCSSSEEASVHQTEWLACTLFQTRRGFSPPCCFCTVLAMISAGHCFPLAPLFLGHLYSQLDLLHDCEIQGDSCYILSAAFNTSVLQTFFWEHSASYVFAARDKSAAWSRFSDLPREFLEQFPDFKDNLPLVYRWVGLKTHDHDLVDALDYEENVLFRPYGDDHPGFTCASIFRKFYGPSPLIRDLKVDDLSEFVLLVHREPGLPSSLVCHGCLFHPLLSTAAFLKSRAFARWGGVTKLLCQSTARPQFPTLTHAPPSQSAISYANSQKLGFAEWDESRGGWIAYTIHLPEGWRNSVNVVEDRLIMLSKRGKVNKRDAPVDPAIEKTPKKATPSVSSSKKVSSKKAKTVKKSKPPLLVPSAAKESTTALVQKSTKSATAPPKRKTRAGKESKSTPSVPSAVEESTAASLWKNLVSPPRVLLKSQKLGRKVSPPAPSIICCEGVYHGSCERTYLSPPLLLRSPRVQVQVLLSRQAKRVLPPVHQGSQKKINVSSSSPDEEEPSTVSTPSPPKKKKFTAPLFPLGAAGRTRSKSGPKVAHGSGRSGGGVVDVEDSDVADDDVIASPVRKDAPQAAAVDQDEDMGKSTAGSSEAGDESMGEEHFSSSDSLFDSTPAGSTEEDLAIVPHAGHDDDSAVDADVDPISFSLPQTVPTRAGSDVSIAHVMEGISLFGVTPSLRAIPAGGFVIPASHLTSEDSPVVGGALMPEETHAQSLVESGSVVDLGVDAAGHDAPIEDAGISAVDTLAGSDHLENIGVDDAVHVSEEIDEVGITGESSLEDVTKAQILAWRSVIQDLMDVGFDLGFMMERLRQMAQRLFGKRLADEIKALQHQIALLQDSLAELTAYQDAMMSTGGVDSQV
uniref:Aminotransferase-like plant mobile domain-containing protein n=1 Tax=Fagus sylvatica TaxID=28930 RepID=A0A2N9HRA7_FAGSY